MKKGYLLFSHIRKIDYRELAAAGKTEICDVFRIFMYE